MLQQKLIKAKHAATITSNLPALLAFHERFLGALAAGSAKEKAFSSVLQQLCTVSLVCLYSAYSRGYYTALDVFAAYSKSRRLQRFLRSKRQEGKPLSNHLILPIQRVTRYLLLLLGELAAKTRDVDAEEHGPGFT